MKKQHVVFLFSLMSILTIDPATAQKQSVWIGGTPGREQAWNCPKNWSNHALPDIFTDVIIPDVSSQSLANPVIRGRLVYIRSLTLEAGSRLTVEKNSVLSIQTFLIQPENQGLEVHGLLRMSEEHQPLPPAILDAVAGGNQQDK